MAPQLRSRTRAQQQGDTGERLAEERLTASGWHIVGRNIRIGQLEIDLLAVDPGPPAALVLVEVRWRRGRAYGLPEDTVDWRKRRRLRAAYSRLIGAGQLPDGTALPPLPMRIDLVAVEPPEFNGGEMRMRHYRAAVGG